MRGLLILRFLLKKIYQNLYDGRSSRGIMREGEWEKITILKQSQSLLKQQKTKTEKNNLKAFQIQTLYSQA
jgi:hypothetical protein